MADAPLFPPAATSIAVVGLACRFPGADDPPELLDAILTGRRAFRRLPPALTDLADRFGPDPATADAARRARAALIEGWQFDRAAFRVPAATFEAAGPAPWLALETAARALAAAGFPGGAGLDRDRIGVLMGSTAASDASRAQAMRLRWPYVRRVLAESLFASDVRADRARRVLRHAAARYLAPLPRPGDAGAAGGPTATIPARISSYFGFRGGSQAVDAECASSLQAVAAACAALTARDIDVAVAGGVDVSIDPLELIALAKAGPAAGDMRLYDENPTGYLPGEGCGVVVLMRTAQARAAGLPVYAEIVGWGSSAGGIPGIVASDASSQLLALGRAYERAAMDPREVQLIEGHGSGTADGDEAELTALAELRAGAREAAALGSIKANIGHAKAAAGAAGLIKTVLALSTGVIPPATGVVRPHPLLRGEHAALWLPEIAETWPSGHRVAGVSAMGAGGVNVHLVLRGAPERGSRYDRVLRALPRLARAGSGRERAACAVRAAGHGRRPAAYLLHAPDRAGLAAVLARVAGVAGWLSDAELLDLACQLGRDARVPGPARVAIVASHQDELARLAGQAIALLPGLRDGLLTSRAGIFAAENADGRVTLLLSDEAVSGTPDDAAPVAAGSAAAGALSSPEAITRPLDALRWLDSLEVSATAAVGHGLGEIAGLAWAGVASQADVTEIAALRAEFLSGPAVRMLGPVGRHAGNRAPEPFATDTLSLLRAAVAQFQFGPPRRRLISTRTGRELASSAEVIELICGRFGDDDRLAQAVTAGAQGATLLVETGPGRLLAAVAARASRVPAVTLDSGGTVEAGRAWAGAALFAAGAIGQVAPLFSGQPFRPIDIWRDQVFIAGVDPTAAEPLEPAPVQPAAAVPSRERASQPGPAAADAPQPAPARPTEPAAAGPLKRPVGSPAAAAASASPMVPAARTASAADAAPVRPLDTRPGQPAARSAPRAQSPAWAPPATSVPPGPAPVQPAPAAPRGSTRAPAAPGPHLNPSRPPSATEAAPAPAAPGQPAPVPPARPGQAAPEAPMNPDSGHANGGAWWRPGRAADRTRARRAGTHPVDAGPGRSGAGRTSAGQGGAGQGGAGQAGAGQAGAGQAGEARTELAGAGADAAGRLGAAGETGWAPGGVTGVGPWARCFTEKLRPVAQAAKDSVAEAAVSGADGLGTDLSGSRPWRMRVAEDYPLKQEVGDLFLADPGAPRSLAVIGDPAAPGGIEAVLGAARDALATGQLTAITTGADVTGFLACLHAEHPELGITVIRVKDGADGLRAAAGLAGAEPGRFLELVIGADGSVTEPAQVATDMPGGGDFPLGPSDVALVSRSCGGAALALVQVLACSGAAVVVIGRDGEDDDSAAVTGLEELRQAGARISYEVVDTASPADMALAVQRVERRLGPVTAVALAASAGPPLPVAELTLHELGAHLGAARSALRDLLSPVRGERLRLIVTFGSVAARYGVARQGLLAAASALLAGQAAAVAADITGCRALHVELPGWSGRGLGERSGVARSMAEGGMAPIAVSDAARLLLRTLTTPGLPGRVAVHGRTGAPGPGRRPDGGRAPARGLEHGPGEAGQGTAGPGGRFLDEVRVHYPGIELICDARLSLSTDPYLADYRVDGQAVLPPVLAVEALAQAASVLAGRPLRHVADLTMGTPVLIPADGGTTRIRVCALAEGGVITAVLRAGEAGAGAEHLRARFPLDGVGAAGGTADGGPGTADPERTVLAALTALADGAAGIVDGAELYGPVCFQSGRFRRIAVLSEITSRGCRAVARSDEDRPWFSPGAAERAGAERAGTESAGAERAGAERAGDAGTWLLGSPGLNDTALQVLQACVPHRRVWLAGCESAVFCGGQAEGQAAVIRARATPAGPQRATAGPATAGPATAGPATAGPATRAEVTWDVEVTGRAGQVLAAWRGIRLREAGPLPRQVPWPPALLSAYLERSAISLGLDPSLRMAVRYVRPHGEVPSPRSGNSPADPPAAQAAVPRQGAQPGRGAVVTGTSRLAGFTLEASGVRSAACGWAPADPQHPVWPASGDGMAATFSRLCAHLSEPPVSSAARLQAVAACLASAQAPESAVVTFERTAQDGWALLEVAGTQVACVVVEISGVSCPVAIAVLTSAPRPDNRYGRAGSGAGHRAGARS